MLERLWTNPDISYDELADMTRRNRTTIMRNLRKLKNVGLLRRVGSDKTGHWEVRE